MSKVQLLYEKIMKIMFIFTGIFFVLCIIILFFAMGDGVIDCSDTMLCSIDDTYGFYTYSILPLAIGTIVFLVLGRVFYSMAYRERKLQTVEEYKAELDRKSYDKWRQMTKDQPRKSKKYTPEKEKQIVKQEPVQEPINLTDQTPEEKIKLIKKEGALTKTRLIAYISEVHQLSLIEARSFVNALFQVMTMRLNNNDNVDIDEFGRIEKLVNSEGIHVEFFPYGELSDELKLESFEYESLYVPPVEVKNPRKDDVLKEQLKQAERLAQAQREKEEAEVKQAEEESAMLRAVKMEQKQKEERERLEQQRQEKLAKEKAMEEARIAQKEKEAAQNQTPQVKKVVLAKKKPQPLTKTKLIASIASATGISKNKSDKFVKSLLDVIQQSLLEREDVQFEGIGKITTIEMPAKKAVNPQTGESIVVPAHHQVRFRFNSDFEQKFKE